MWSNLEKKTPLTCLHCLCIAYKSGMRRPHWGREAGANFFKLLLTAAHWLIQHPACFSLKAEAWSDHDTSVKPDSLCPKPPPNKKHRPRTNPRKNTNIQIEWLTQDCCRRLAKKVNKALSALTDLNKGAMRIHTQTLHLYSLHPLAWHSNPSIV